MGHLAAYHARLIPCEVIASEGIFLHACDDVPIPVFPDGIPAPIWPSCKDGFSQNLIRTTVYVGYFNDCLAIDKKEYIMAKLPTFLSNCCLDHEANREIESALARISSLASGPGCCRSLLSTRGSTGSRSHRRTLHCPNMRKDQWMNTSRGRWPLGWEWD